MISEAEINPLEKYAYIFNLKWPWEGYAEMILMAVPSWNVAVYSERKTTPQKVQWHKKTQAWGF